MLQEKTTSTEQADETDNKQQSRDQQPGNRHNRDDVHTRISYLNE